ncbi:MAG: hypothetical protein Fur0022_21320 [Anaerolineales bacterium]
MYSTVEHPSLSVSKPAPPDMQATRSTNAVLGGVPSSFPFPNVSGCPAAPDVDVSGFFYT